MITGLQQRLLDVLRLLRDRWKKLTIRRIVAIYWKLIRVMCLKMGNCWNGTKPRIIPDTSKTVVLKKPTISKVDDSKGTMIYLDGVACSLYPFSGGGIPNASRSSQNLDASRSAHLQRNSRNASRSSLLDGPENSGSVPLSGSMPSIVLRQPTLPMEPVLSPVTERFGDRPYTFEQEAIELPEVASPHASTEMLGVPDRQPSLARPSSSASLTLHTSHGTSTASASVAEITHEAFSVPELGRDDIIPVMPQSTGRYKDKPRIKKEWTNIDIKPLTISFNEPNPPTGWTKHIHPEGVGYFSKQTNEFKVWTEGDLTNSKVLEHLEESVGHILQHINDTHIHLPAESDLCVNISFNKKRNRRMETAYYFVNHTTRTVFFLDNYDAEDLDSWSEVWGCRTNSHLFFEIEAQYWFFIMLYPHALTITTPLVGRMRSFVLHFIGDSMTSTTSNAPYSLEDMHKLVNLTDSLASNVGIDEIAGATSLLSRVMYIFVHSQFLNFAGEPHARLERTFSVYKQEKVYSQTWLVKIISPPFFFAPHFHLHTLQKMYVDELLHKSVFDQLMKKMNDEWQQFILFGTVMLNANVAFLAIQSVDNSAGDPHRLPAQIASYVSVMASIGSIVLGLLLTREYRVNDRESADEMQRFIQTRHYAKFQLEILAIIFSLPYALLMWGVVAFVAAFAFLCLQSTDLSTRIIMGISFASIISLIVWNVGTFWTPDLNPDPHQDSEHFEVAEETQMADHRNGTTIFYEGTIPLRPASSFRRASILQPNSSDASMIA